MNEIAVDYGRKRTGFAIFIEGVPMPLDPLTETTWNAIAARLTHIQEENGRSAVVLGLPLSDGGKPTELSLEVEKLADFLADMGFAIELVRETGSTIESMNGSIKGNRQSGRRDSLAALVILKRYLGIP